MRTGLRLQFRSPAALGVATLFIVAACYSGSLASTAPVPASEPASLESAPADFKGPCGSTDVSVDYLPYTTKTLAGYGWDFVIAEVVSFEPATFSTPDGKAPPDFLTSPGENTIYTPVNVVIDNAISGAWSAGPRQFLIEGGTVPFKTDTIDCYTVRVYGAPNVEVGSRYTFIVSEALDSGGVPLGLSKARFAWPVDAQGTVITVDGPMSIDELTNVVLDAAASADPKATMAGYQVYR